MNPLHKRTQRIGPEKICLTPTTKLFYDLVNWTFFLKKKQRIEPLSVKHMAHRIAFFCNVTHIIELFSWKNDSKNCFSHLFQRIEHLIEYDWKNWNTFSDTTQGIEHFLNMIQRIEPLSVKHMTKRIFSNMTHRIEPFSWNNDSENCFFSCDSKNRTLIECDWKNWTLWIRLKELNHSFFSEWLKDLNFVWNMTQWIELSCFHDSKKMNLLFSVTQRVEFF